MAEPSNPIAASAPSQSSQSVNSSSNANPGRKSPAPAAPPPASTQPSSATTSTNTNTRSRKDRPCDACRRRKSRCVMNEDSSVCVLCQFHKQDCTFLQSPQPRKRRLPVATTGSDDEKHLGSNKKRSMDEPESPRQQARKGSSSEEAKDALRRTLPPDDYANLPGPTLLKKTLGLQTHRHSAYLGPTSEYEPVLIDLCPFDPKDEYKPRISSATGGSFRRVADSTTFLMLPDKDTPNQSNELDDLDAIERVVNPHGQALINLYFRIVHPSFPILHKNVFLEKYTRTHREFSPPLLAAVYILALHWWSYDRELSAQKKPDVEALEKLAWRTMSEVIHRPKLSAVQAGLLLLQRPEGDSWILTCQIVAIAQELGLHLDCTGWKIPNWERGLRKRLAWAVFMQDKWAALTHGRPSHITLSNWAVQSVTAGDFPESSLDEDDEEAGTEVDKGRMLFTEMIELTKLTSEVLDGFFTVESQASIFHESEHRGIESVLERAKPVQIKLKEWYSRLPECLRMDSSKVRKLSSNGYLHLAYFATEITLHRSIIRALSPATSLYLVHICRTAAKTRLISAIEFVNRLKPDQLQSFWYFASRVNFALIGTFGSLLWATSQVSIESEFYKARLDEYRWTLKVSSKGATFMDFALKALDASAGYCIEGVSNAIASHGQSQSQLVGAGAKGLSFQKEYEDEIMAEQEEYEDDPRPMPPRQNTQIPDSSRFPNYSYGTPIDQQLQNFGHTPSSNYSAAGQSSMANRRTSMISNNASLDITNQLPSGANASALNFYMMQQQQGNDDFGTADSWAADMERMHVETEDAAARGYEIGT
ncbi:Fungal specific transcription factor [Arthrobotrys musiformis]|uniref:Fungal specific transcription factor n=1 Tax=Arthrobotrys musiformis TaxID=47236 RepID=A0AAV9WDA7_9PEZI